MLLRIRPLEPLVLSRTPLTSHDMFSVHEVLAVPSPTTIIGLLGNLLGISYSNGFLTGLENLLKELTNKCGHVEEEPIIKGPLIYFEELGSNPYVQVKNTLVPITALKCIGAGGLKAFYIDASENIVKVLTEHRVGIKLERGYVDVYGKASLNKVASAGYMYRYTVINYTVNNKSKRLTPIITYDLNCSIQAKEILARIGGESRLSLIEIDEQEDQVFKSVRNPLKAEEGYYIALSPIPLIPALGVLSVEGKNTPGLEFIEEILGIPDIIREPVSLAEVISRSKKRIERLNLGYSEALNKRREQVLALPQGTIIKVKRTESINPVIKILLRIGFSSLLKLSD